MSRHNVASHPRWSAPPTPEQPRRFYPRRGELLGVHHVRGSWRPSGTVAGAGVFAVIWTTSRGATWWAPLHDFTPAAQLELIAQCRRLAQAAEWPPGES